MAKGRILFEVVGDLARGFFDVAKSRLTYPFPTIASAFGGGI